MRRSYSSSSIPGRVSRLPVRESIHPGPSQSSSNKPPGQEKLSLSKMPRMSSDPNLLDAPHVKNKRSGSLVRTTLCTPMSQAHSRYSRLQRTRSPGYSSMKKDNRPITDKQWQVDQLSKVRQFVSKHFDHLELYDVSTIKSGLSIDLFLSLINNFFQILDNEAFVMRDTYMEDVPKILKTFGYPVNIKSSLMKTVNTPHAWPHILAIFSWLSDLICEIDIPEDYAPFSGIYNVIFQDTLQLLEQLNNNTESEDIVRQKCLDNLDEQIVSYLKLDVKQLMDIDNQMERLHTDIEKAEAKKTDLKNKIQAVQVETKELTEKCDTFEHQSETFISQLEQQKNNHKEKIRNMGEEIRELKDKETELQKAVDSQPYSLSEKEELAKEVRSLQGMQELGEQRRQQQQKLIDKYDFDLTNVVKNIQSNAYKYNNMINNLELSNPIFKKLHVRETGFAKMDTEEELLGVNKLLQKAMDKFKKDKLTCDDDIDKTKLKETRISETLDDVTKEVEELNKLEAELALTLEFESKQSDLNRRKLCEEMKTKQNELSDLKKSRLDLTPLENQVVTLQKQKSDLEDLYDKTKSQFLYFLQHLEKQMQQTVLSYEGIMENIYENMINTKVSTENQIDQALESEYIEE